MFFLQNNIASGQVSFLTLLCIVFSSGQAYAAKNQKQHIVDIQAHYLLLDENKGISTYKGKVIFKKETLVIKADTVTLYYENGQLEKALILGSPADVQHAPDNEAKVHSQARKMEYRIEQDKLTLTGQAFVDQGNRHFSGESIVYDTRQRIISASGNQAENIANNGEDATTQTAPPSRVHVIIGPGNETNNTNNDDNNQ